MRPMKSTNTEIRSSWLTPTSTKEKEPCSSFRSSELQRSACYSLEQWVLQQIESVAIRSFEGCKKLHPERAQRMIHGYTKMFRKVKMTGRVLQMADEPANWVSFGFSTEADTLPPWMLGRLLTL